MSEETKCPKCGAEKGHLGFLLCGSRKTVIGFDQSDACRDRENSTLRAALSKAVEAIQKAANDAGEERVIWETEIASEKLSGNIVKEHYAQGRMAGSEIATMILCSVLSELSSLTRAENGDL